MYGVSDGVARAMMRERVEYAKANAEYRDWCRHECQGAARNG